MEAKAWWWCWAVGVRVGGVVNRIQDSKIAQRKVMRGRSFIGVGRFGWVEGRIKSQFIRLPEMIVARAMRVMGVEKLVFSL